MIILTTNININCVVFSFNNEFCFSIISKLKHRTWVGVQITTCAQKQARA